MKALIVFTHPKKNSLNGAFLERTIKGLEKNSSIEELEVLDLYAEGFNPALVFDDQNLRRDMHRVKEMQSYQKQIKRADLIVMIYPIWWGRPPAMLLGYIDRLFASDFAYKTRKGSPFPEGLFKGKRVICISTMKGPVHYPLLFLNNAHKVLMKKAVCNFTGIRRVRFFEFGSMERKEGRQRKKLEKIEAFMEKRVS